MRCDACIYFTDENEGKGSCHRYPPTVLNADGTNIQQARAVVSRDDFCGEFARREDRRKKERTGKFDPM